MKEDDWMMRGRGGQNVEIKNRAALDAMRRGGKMLGAMREEVKRGVEPGVSTLDLDRIFQRLCEEAGVKAAFHGLYGFKGHICSSVNEEVVHGIPSGERILQNGDIVSLDMGIIVDGYYTDTAVTVPVGTVSEETGRLLEATRRSLEAGIAACRPGARIGDIGHAVQQVVEEAGFSVVREYTGHGVGRRLHEPPQVPNFGTPGRGQRLCEGWVLALEPMVSAGAWKTETLEDDWTVVTEDRRPSAHFEHTIAVLDDGAEVLT